LLRVLIPALLFLGACRGTRDAVSPDEFVVSADRGIRLADGDLGGAVRVHRMEHDGPQPVWTRTLFEFHGLLFDRRLRTAVVDGEFVVYTAAKDAWFKANAATGTGFREVDASDATVRRALASDTLADDRVRFDPEASDTAPQYADAR